MARLPQVGGDTGNWGEILNEYLSQSLSSNGSLNIETVGNPQLKNGAVSSFKLADTAVTSNKLAPGAVTTSHIADGAIGQHQLADNAITPAKLRNPGQANGVALLDSNAKIAEVQLPSRLGVDELTSSIVNVSGYSTHERKIESFLLPGEHLDTTGATSVDAVRQRALDALSAEYLADASSSVGKIGKILVWPEGKFRLSAQATARTGVGERGQGMDLTIFYPEGRQAFINGAASVVNPANTYDDITYSGFTIDGKNQTHTAYDFSIKGFYIQGMKRFRCENVKVKNTWATGFGFDFIQGGDFINCIAENCGRGRAISGTTRVGSGAGFGYGSGLFEEEKVRFINCVSENNYTYGFFTEYVATRPEVTYRSRGIQAVGCSASGNNYGFLDAGSNGALITSCVFSGNESAGFALDLTHASPGGGINGKLSNCVITKNGASGNGSGVVIATIGPGGYSIADNEIFGNEGPGIRISNSSAYTANTRLAFTGNRIHDNNGAAFRAARALPDKCRIDGNETWNNTAALEIIGAYTANNLRIRFNDFAESSSITQTLNGTIVVSNEGLSSRTPINPIATFAASTPGQVTLSWTAPMETADDYRVEWMNVPVGTWNTVSRTASPNTSQVITGLPSFTQVQFRVASIIGGSIGSYATTSATRLIPTALHADYYNRADQTLAGKSLPDGSNSTATWSDVDSAAWSILSNSIRPDTYYSGRKSLVMDAGSATGTVRAKFSSSGSGTDLGASGILVRYVDASNYIVVDMSSAGGWNLRKCVAGTYTTIAAVSASKNVGDVVIVQFTGSNYTVTVNDALPVTATDSTHATATRRGFIQTGITSGSRMKWDDFETWNIAG